MQESNVTEFKKLLTSCNYDKARVDIQAAFTSCQDLALKMQLLAMLTESVAWVLDLVRLTKDVYPLIESSLADPEV